MKFVTKTRIINAVQFLGEDEGMPQWVSVRGTKLPANQREGEFYDKNQQIYPRARYKDWILYTDDGAERWVLDEESFRKAYEPVKSPEVTPEGNETDSETKPSCPTLPGHTMLGLGFR